VTNVISNSLLAKPIAFVGRYHNVVEILLREHVKLLIPKVIWIEYRTVPILSIVRSLGDYQLINQFFFLEITTLEMLSQLLQSKALLSIDQQGFSTLLIDVPSEYSFPLDFCVRFQELMKRINIILIMDELVVPQTQIKLIRVESGE
jgi:hypothetical protein